MQEFLAAEYYINCSVKPDLTAVRNKSEFLEVMLCGLGAVETFRVPKRRAGFQFEFVTPMMCLGKSLGSIKKRLLSMFSQKRILKMNSFARCSLTFMNSTLNTSY